MRVLILNFLIGKEIQINKIALFKKISNVINTAFAYISAVLLFAMFLLGTTDVAGRYLFRRPIIGTVEIFEILLPAIVLLSLGYTQQNKAHISIDLFYSNLSSKKQLILSIALTFWSIILFILIGWQGIVLCFSYYQTNNVITNIGIPMFIPRTLVPIGAFGIFLILIVDLFDFINKIKGEIKKCHHTL